MSQTPKKKSVVQTPSKVNSNNKTPSKISTPPPSSNPLDNLLASAKRSSRKGDTVDLKAILKLQELQTPKRKRKTTNTTNNNTDEEDVEPLKLDTTLIVKEKTPIGKQSTPKSSIKKTTPTFNQEDELGREEEEVYHTPIKSIKINKIDSPKTTKSLTPTNNNNQNNQNKNNSKFQKPDTPHPDKKKTIESSNKIDNQGFAIPNMVVPKKPNQINVNGSKDDGGNLIEKLSKTLVNQVQEELNQKEKQSLEIKKVNQYKNQEKDDEEEEEVEEEEDEEDDEKDEQIQELNLDILKQVSKQNEINQQLKLKQEQDKKRKQQELQEKIEKEKRIKRKQLKKARESQKNNIAHIKPMSIDNLDQHIYNLREQQQNNNSNNHNRNLSKSQSNRLFVKGLLPGSRVTK